MKYIIYGAGIKGKEFYMSLPNKVQTQINAFIDRDKGKQGHYIDGKNIYPIEYIFKENKDICIIIAMRNRFLLEAYKALYSNGFTGKVAIMKFVFKFDDNNDADDINSYINYVDCKKPLLEYLETDIVSHCNLRCRGCGHYAEKLAPSFVDPLWFDKDVKRLAELYSGCEKFRIMGGEPFLHPDIIDFAEAVRFRLPLSDIRIVTNGLLIPKMAEKILNKLHMLEIEIDISLYPPTAKIIENLKKRLDAFNIRYNISQLIDKFYDFNSSDENDYIEAYHRCLYPQCHSMQNGYISVCYAGLFSARVAKITGRNISAEEVENNRFSLYDSSLTGEKLNMMLRSPIPACKYCGALKPSPQQIPWKQNL